MMQRWQWSSRALIALVCLVLLLPRLPVHGQTAAAPYTGMDVVFLVDQSGSMGGAAFGLSGRTGTDPLGLRFEAVRYAFDTLGEYRVNIAPDLSTRMAVVSFGDATELTLPWTELAPTPDVWDRTRDRLLETLSVDRFGRRNLGDTNFRAAFSSAEALFAELGRDPARLRVIILLTDGAPCVSVGEMAFDCTALGAQQAFMEDLLRQVAGAFRQPNDLIYVMALDNTGTIWPLWSDEWSTVAGQPSRATVLTTNQEIGVRFRDILSELVGILRPAAADTIARLQPGANRVFVPPYHRLVRVSLFKSALSPGVLSVQQPDGQPLDTSTITVDGADRAIEVWTIPHPQPGDWVFTVGSTADQMSVYLELVPLDVAAAFISSDVPLFTNVPFSVTLTDPDGRPLPTYADFPLIVAAALTAPDGTISELPLAAEADSTFSGTVLAAQPGRYIMGVRATVDVNGDAIPLVAISSIGEFSVRGITLTLDPLERADYLIGETLTITARVNDTNGAPAAAAEVSISAALQAADSPPTAVLLTRDSPGVYTAAVPLTTAGAFRLTVSSSAALPDGAIVAPTAPVAAAFTVFPAQPVRLVRTLPDTADQEQVTTEGFPPLTPTDLVVAFTALSEAANQPVDLAALALEPAALWTIAVSHDGQPIAAPPLTSSAPGQYELRLPNPAPGRYAIAIGAAGQLRDRYLLADDAGISVRVNRVINPAVYTFFGTLAALALLLIGLIISSTIRYRARRRHPIQGQIALARVENNVPERFWIFDAGSRGVNRIVLTGRQLPREVALDRLVLTCADDRQSKDGVVFVTAVRAGQPVIDHYRLGPGAAVALRPAPPKPARGKTARKPTAAASDSIDFGGGGSVFGSGGGLGYLIQKDPDNLGSFSTTDSWFS